MNHSLPPVLIIEDDAAQVEILRRVLRRARIANPIRVASDGDEAEAYLAAADGDGSPVPVLVLLDLYLPGRNGLDLLTLIRRTHAAVDLPVIVLSGSQSADDIDEAFALGANSYLVKPVAFAALIDTLENMSLPWAIMPPAALTEDDVS